MSRPRSLSRSWLIVPAIPILFTHTPTLARCAEDPACRSHLDSGMALDLDGKYEPALREFQAAYKAQRDPRVALNIGRSLHKLGRFAEALPMYKEAGRAAPADTELQKQLQEFIPQAQQNLPSVPLAQKPVTVVNQVPITLQTAPVTSSSNASATAINNTTVKIDLGPQVSAPKPLYQRMSLWGPLIGVTLLAGAGGIAAALWPRPWQPDPNIPGSPYSPASVGGAQ